MARVNLDSYAFDDCRFDVLAALVKHFRDRWHALGYVTRVWHACASRRVKALRPIEVASLLGYKRPANQSEEAAAAICEAGLGELLPDGTVRIRGTDGRTDYLDDGSDELTARIVAHVTEHGPSKRADVMAALGLQQSQRSSFYAAVKQAIRDGGLTEANGLICAVSDACSPSIVQSSPNPETSNKTSRTRSLALAPVLALAPEEQETHTAGARVYGPVQEASTGASSVDVQSGSNSGLVSRLYAYRAELVRRYQAEAHVRDLGEFAVAHTIAEMLHHPLLTVTGSDGRKGPREESEIKHALDMVAAQADEKAKAGEDVTWSLLAKAFSPRVLASGLECPDEKTARQRAVRGRGRGKAKEHPGVRTAPNEHYRDKGLGECEI